MSKVWERVDIHERLRFSNDADTLFCRWDLDPLPVSDVVVTIPSLTADDTFLFAELAATLTNKTINGGTVRLTRFGTESDDIIAYEPSTYPAITLGAPSAGQYLIINDTTPVSLTWGTFSTLPEYIGDFYDAGPYSLSGLDSGTMVSYTGFPIVDGTYRIGFSLEHMATANSTQYNIYVNLITSAPSNTTLHNMEYAAVTNNVPTFYPVSGFSYHNVSSALTYTIEVIHDHIGIAGTGTTRRITLEVWRVA